MSLTSYRTAPPRVNYFILYIFLQKHTKKPPFRAAVWSLAL